MNFIQNAPPQHTPSHIKIILQLILGPTLELADDVIPPPPPVAINLGDVTDANTGVVLTNCDENPLVPD